MSDAEAQIAGLPLGEVARLVETNLAAQYAHLQELSGSEFSDNDVLTWFRSAVPQPFFNVVARRSTYANIAYVWLAFPLGLETRFAGDARAFPPPH